MVMLKYMCYISMEGEPFGAVFGASNIPIGLMVIKLKEEMLGEKNETVAFSAFFLKQLAPTWNCFVRWTSNGFY